MDRKRRQPKSSSSGRLTLPAAAGAALVCLLCARCGEVNGPAAPATRTVVILRLDLAKEAAAASIDSIRFTLSSGDLPHDVTRTFSFAERRGSMEKLPMVTSLQVKMEALDSLGSVAFWGVQRIEAVDGDTVDVGFSGDDITPLAPGPVNATALSHDRIRVSWRSAAAHVTHFIISRRRTVGGAVEAQYTTADTALVDSSGLAPATTYLYCVYAVNAVGPSNKASTQPITTDSVDRTPPRLTVLSHQRRDTSGTRVISLYGTATDVNGIASVGVGGTFGSLDNSAWRVDGVYLADSVNRFVVWATDNSAFHNVAVETLWVVYRPGWVDVANRPPRFSVPVSEMNATVKAGQTYRRTLRAYDPDVLNRVRFRAVPPLALASDSIVQWTPSMGDTGTRKVKAYVYDQDSACDSLVWTIVVVDSARNTPPVFVTRKADMEDSVMVGRLYIDTVAARDAEQSIDLRYRLLACPGAMTIDGQRGVLQWTPTAADLGIAVVTVQVSDDSGATATLAWAVTVWDPALPVADAGRDTLVSLGDTVHLRGSGTSATGGQVSFEWDIGNTGRFVAAPDGVLDFTAPTTAVDSLVCVLRVTDTDRDQALDRMVVRVSEGRPVLVAGPDTVVRMGQTVTLRATATDSMGHIVTWEWDPGRTGHYSIGPAGRFVVTAPMVNGPWVCGVRVVDDDGVDAVAYITVYVVGMTMRSAASNPALPTQDGLALMIMGTDSGRTEEGPVHRVLLHPFMIDTTEVTQREYQDVMGLNPVGSGGGAFLPVSNITWFDAVLFCNARSKRDGFDTVYRYTKIDGMAGNGCTGLSALTVRGGVVGYRLPTEAEWEYACRGDGSTSTYHWGAGAAGAATYAWYSANAKATAHAVAQKSANAAGLYDMAGNVWEWCQDWFSTDYYRECAASGTTVDPWGPASGVTRVIRGGSYESSADDLRTARRNVGVPSWRSNLVGFRCVLPVSGQ